MEFISDNDMIVALAVIVGVVLVIVNACWAEAWGKRGEKKNDD